MDEGSTPQEVKTMISRLNDSAAELKIGRFVCAVIAVPIFAWVFSTEREFELFLPLFIGTVAGLGALLFHFGVVSFRNQAKRLANPSAEDITPDSLT